MPLPLSGRRRAVSRALVGATAAALLAGPLAVAVGGPTASAATTARTGASTGASTRASTGAGTRALAAEVAALTGAHPGRTAASGSVRLNRLQVHLSRAVRAKHALVRAQRALSPTTTGHRPDATLALRRLWLLRGALSRSDQKIADKLDGRPSSNQVDCSSPIACVHWTAGAVAPDWPATVRNVITYVGDTYRAAGYRATLPDDGLGGSDATDIYITNLPAGLYGYCTTDQKRLSAPGHFNVWAFCVLDDDYSEFPNHTPLENLEVTAAHEFYHATQYAYDAAEDPWLLESTAVTMEDELYSDVNDNLQYLRTSPITKPGESMDNFDQHNLIYYGVWNFWRYLIQKFPQKQGPLPKLLLEIWKYADSSRGPRHDLYSLQAINKALKKVGHTTLAKEFAYYSDATRRTHDPSLFNEGAANHYPVKKLAGKAKLGHGGRRTFRAKLDHLTSATYRFTPAGGGKHAKLKLNFDLGGRPTGSEAVVTVYKKGGAARSKLVKLNAAGNAVKSFGFGGSVRAVEVTLVNASLRMKSCYATATPYSCSGTPVDMNVPEQVTGNAIG